MSIVKSLNSIIEKVGVSGRAANERRNVRRAIHELEALSDRELNDLGIGRGNIKQVVLNGRDIDHNNAA